MCVESKSSTGEDLLFDIRTRRLVKFALHTNVPGHFDFGIYNRAEFKLKFGSVQIGTESKLDEFRSIFTPASQCSSIDDEFSESDEPTGGGPVVLNKCSSEGENPFGATFCYGTNQLIVEVLDNGHIASVVLFDERLGP
uniref:Uncharacterized protein n=1 Tax=Globodera pallida TaxID=36090 RepID=A0A183BHH2_GLOPA